MWSKYGNQANLKTTSNFKFQELINQCFQFLQFCNVSTFLTIRKALLNLFFKFRSNYFDSVFDIHFAHIQITRGSFEKFQYLATMVC
jgi:hypothetical protein